MAAASSLLPVSPSKRLGLSSAATAARRSQAQAREAVVADRLLAFLAVPGLRYRDRPTPLTGGWETYTYGFQFDESPDLPAGLRGPLVLRIYATERGAPRARREFAVQSFAYARGFPTARPILIDEDGEPLGGPFLLMQRLRGRALLEVLQARPWRLWDLPRRMAELHARLHQLPPEGFPDAAADFLDRSLDEIRARVVAYGLDGLRPGLEWLAANRPRRTGVRRPLHLDWHPQNLILCGDTLSAIDWVEAAVGDRHADVATSLVLMLCCPVPACARWQRPFIPAVRAVLARRYLRAYRRRLPLDETRLTFYAAWAALRRLAGYGRWIAAGPGSNGCKASVLRKLSPAHFRTLCNYFARHSGVEVKLECEGW
jgi:aminoglycoside phosphotransferase (APT) family kinase protein